MNVLIVDDDELSRISLGHLIQHLGHNVISVSSAEEAMEHLGWRSNDDPTVIHMVFTDWEMSGKNGLELIKQIRERDIKIPVIVLTVKDRYHDLQVALNAGADGYMAKPFKHNELIYRLEDGQRTVDSSKQ